MSQEIIIEPQPSEMINEVNQAQGLPSGQAPVETPPVAAAPEVAPEVEAAPAEGTFDFDGQKFASEKDAFEYLQGQHGNLKTEQMLDQARLQGMQDAYSNIPSLPLETPAPLAPVDPAADMDKFYENPAEYLQNMKKQMKTDLDADWNNRQAAVAKDAEVWNNFTNKYPDLADFRDEVESIATVHGDTIKALAARDAGKAMEFVALKTREKFQRYAEAMKPTKVLSNVKTNVAVGVNPPVNNSQNSPEGEKSLDFVSQLRTMRR